MRVLYSSALKSIMSSSAPPTLGRSSPPSSPRRLAEEVLMKVPPVSDRAKLDNMTVWATGADRGVVSPRTGAIGRGMLGLVSDPVPNY